MTSLIFWGPYLAHKGIIHQKREKQRVKNYERWEGLRDEYDEQRKISRDSRSLDIQRTGTWDAMSPQTTGRTSYDDNDRGIFTLRDQQEANDARTGWRPQEAWESPRSQVQAQMTGQVQQTPQFGFAGQPFPVRRHVSSTPAVPSSLHQAQTQTPLRTQRTGATWDAGLPAPLQVSRRSFDDYDHSQQYRPASLGTSRDTSRRPSQSRTHTPSGLSESVAVSANALPALGWTSPAQADVTSVIERPKNEFGFVDPAYARPAPMSIAGGRMAELIERGY